MKNEGQKISEKREREGGKEGKGHKTEERVDDPLAGANRKWPNGPRNIEKVKPMVGQSHLAVEINFGE
jgi:hypothetical protein